MREIKFRAWYKVYGKQQWIYSDEHGLPLFFGIVINKDLGVMQYTGLKDKNGKEIYEGDILKYTRFGWQCLGHLKHNTDLVTYYEVRWSDEYSAFRVENRSMSGSPHFEDSRARKNEVEVIGNIYENPELLKKEE